MRTLVNLFIVITLVGCGQLPKSDDPPIIEGLPRMIDIADSLNNIQAQSVKWSVNSKDSSVQYVQVKSINWKKEFEAFLKDDVNRLRFQDAYSVADELEGDVRTVRFTANSNKQEIRSVELRLQANKLVYYRIHKERNNLLSNSLQIFVFDHNHYELEVNQSIDWFFENKQYIYGNILPKGDVWRGYFQVSEAQLPIQLVLNDKKELTIKNGDERLTFPYTETRNDSSVYHSAYFNAFFILKQTDSSTITGRWVNAKRDRIKSLAFHAEKNKLSRFEVSNLPSINLSGEHGIYFLDSSGLKTDSSLLILNQVKHHVNGSILTETGDYRHLEGLVRNDSLFLSTMDGTHGYLFKAAIEDGQLRGLFFAGRTWKEAWEATLNKPIQLRSPEKITQMKPNAAVSFSFKDISGKRVSLSDQQFQNKVVLISIMGTWCSNCLDESLFLQELATRYKTNDLAIIALDFELTSDSATAKANVDRYIKNLGLNYPVLLARLGTTKQRASEVLPYLNGVHSFPTLLVLNKAHKVERIHTGFSGPATGHEYYDAFRMKYVNLIDSLVRQ